MEPYNFWQDFFNTYRLSSDLIKALWVIVPPAFLVAPIWVIVHSRPVRPHRDETEGTIDQQKSRID